MTSTEKTSPSSTAISQLFERLRAERRKALVGYLTAGDPSLDRTPALVAALVRGGVDLIELGVPFSDPIADGPVIQRASERALAAGTTLRGVLATAAEIRRATNVPLLLFTYLNPVIKYGLEALARDASQAGFGGVLLTDLSVEEAGPYIATFRKNRLDTVFLAAPTSTPERRRLIAESSSGFVYLVSRTGVTGEQASLSAAAAPLVESMRAVTDLPLAVGFGISTPEQVAQAGAVADAVVVGSAFVRLIEKNASEAELEDFARKLKQGLAA
ncbi:MAG: tryptophan synthase subunit alpha [Acidobacteriota bacterium]